MSLIEKMLKSGTSKEAAVLSESNFFTDEELVPLSVPILNVAFSGRLEGGLIPGLTFFAGESKTFKTLLALYCMKSYLNQHPDSVALLYDSEFGITPEYLKSYDIDIERVIHIPITDVEELKFDIIKRLRDVDKGDKLFIMIDSIGNLASKKEVEDAENEKSVADMSRAKSMKSLWRIITPHLNMKKIPCVAINHIYYTMEMYSKAVVSGGSGGIYSADTIFIITKAQEKDEHGVSGFRFCINIEKSRYVKEKRKLFFWVSFEKGIQKWSHMFDLATEAGLVQKSGGWYSLVDLETGEVNPNKVRRKDIENDDSFFEALVKNKKFSEFVEERYHLNGTIDPVIEEEAVEVRLDDGAE